MVSWAAPRAQACPNAPPLPASRWTKLKNLAKDRAGNPFFPGTLLLRPDSSVLVNFHELTGFYLAVDCLAPGCNGERTFAVAELASFYGQHRTVREVLRRTRCSGACRVGAAWLATGPILNARIRARRLTPKLVTRTATDRGGAGQAEHPYDAGQCVDGDSSRRGRAGRRQWATNRVFSANRSISLTGLSPERRSRLYGLAFQRFSQRTVAARDGHASDAPGGIASEAEAVDELVAKVEVCLAD
jgi:hypothetical protein